MKSVLKLILMAALLGLTAGQLASALETEPACAIFVNQSTDWGPITKSVPKFDPSLGILTEVRLTGDACGYQSFKLDSEDTRPQCWTVKTSGVLSTSMPVGPNLILNLPETGERTRDFCLPADNDGNADFIGTDSYADVITDCSDAQRTFTGAELSAWIGPGTVDFTANSDATTLVEGSANFDQRVRTFTNQTICVVYVYEPFFCINGTKINDCTDEGLEGWTITLLDDAGALIDTKTTDANGDYSFCELVAGDYQVCEELEDNWNAEGPTCIDVTLVDSDVIDIDFRNSPVLCIEGYKLNNCTGEGLDGWTINLKDSTGVVIDTEITDADGKYLFCGLEAYGTYTVCEESMDGWVPAGEECIDVTLVCENATDVNFENDPLLCINGTKINDCNDLGLAGWTIKLYSEYGLEMGTRTTDANGDYSFCGLAPGDYNVCEVPMAGWEPVGDECIDVALGCENSEDNDFRNAPLLCINGTKINDYDDQGLEGWTIKLYSESGLEMGTRTTDANGDYSFCGLLPGSYRVCEILQPNWVPVGNECIDVTLECEDSNGNDFRNAPAQKEVCETIWANWGDDGTCLIPDCANNWGWYTMASLEDLKDGITSDVWAAAGQCDLDKGFKAGTVTVTLNDEGDIVLDFDINDNCDLEEWHLWVNDKTLCPHRGFSKWYKGMEDYTVIDIGKLTDVGKDGVFVAVHGGVCCMCPMEGCNSY